MFHPSTRHQYASVTILQLTGVSSESVIAKEFQQDCSELSEACSQFKLIRVTETVSIW